MLLFVFLFCFAIAEFVPSIKNTGSKWVFTREAGNQLLLTYIIPTMESSINGLALSDLSGTAKTSIGKVDYSMKNIQMRNFAILSDGIRLDSARNIVEADISVNGEIKLDYSYAMLSFPYTSDEGVATIRFNDAKVVTEIKPGRSKEYTMTLELIYLDVDISKFDVDIESDMAWLYSLILDICKDQITEGINAALTNAFSQALKNIIDNYLKWGNTMYPSGNGAIIDIAFTNEQAVTIYDEWATAQISWYSVPYENNYNPNDRSRFEGETEVPPFDNIYNGKGFQLLISRQRVEEITRVQYATDYVSKTFSKDGVYDRYFVPSFWYGVLDLSQFNDVTSWSYSVHFSDNMTMEFLASAIRIKTEITMKFIDQNNMERFSISLSSIIAAQPYVGEACLSITQDINKIENLKMVNGGVPVIGNDYSGIEDFLHDVVFVFVNSQVHRGGFPYNGSGFGDELFVVESESFEIVPDGFDVEGYLAYSKDLKTI